MTGGILFKQRYRSRNLPGTAALNVRHLEYIATRPGAVPNPGCGFSLWGQLPGVSAPEQINDLRRAREIVRTASGDHTLWRVILSADDATAKEHNLYDRGAWERLVNEKIGVLAREMDIRGEDFCWLASMHHVKGHPHVHILYWDRSDAIHQELIPGKRFEIMAEHVRSAFSRELFREELNTLRREQRELDNTLRLELRVMLRDSNPPEVFDLRRLKAETLDELGKGFLSLASRLPRKGSMKYAHLPAGWKAECRAYLDTVMKLPDFAKLGRQYEKLTEEISRLHGNGGETTAHQLSRARETLYRDLGNELLRLMKEYRKELETGATAEEADLKTVLSHGVRQILTGSERYKELLAQMPTWRTPMAELRKDEGFEEIRRALVRELASDFRIRSLLHGCEKAAKDGERITDRMLYGVLGRLTDEQLVRDCGYDSQERASRMADVLLRLFADGSQSRGQLQSRRDLLRARRGSDLSKTAKRDRQKRRERESGWEPER